MIIRFLCKRFGHRWDKCICRRCRESRHEWDGCVCTRCGTAKHRWVTGRCAVCGTEHTHDWVFMGCEDFGEQDYSSCGGGVETYAVSVYQCSICGAIRMEDHGDFNGTPDESFVEYAIRKHARQA